MLIIGCPSQQGEILMTFRLKIELINDEQPFREKKNIIAQTAHTYGHQHIPNLEQVAAVSLECAPSAMSQLISHYV